MICIYDKNHHNCKALSLHVLFPYDYPDSPCDTCGQHRINELEEKLKHEEYTTSSYEPGGTNKAFFYRSEKKKNCFYYLEEKDMGATIPCCKKRSQIGDCPCDCCDEYISKADAYRIVEAWQKAKKEVK